MHRSLKLVPLAAVFALAAPAVAQEDAKTADHAHAAHAATAPTSGYRAELIADIDRLEGKYLALAEAMAGKYDWRPGEGVRSVGEVFLHVAGANFAVPTMAGVEPPEAMRAESMQAMFAKLGAMEKETAAADVPDALRHGFMHARHAIAQIDDADMDAKTQMFGQEVTKRQVLSLLVTHMHEHLGQAIAYARTNGVVPPWSAGGE